MRKRSLFLFFAIVATIRTGRTDTVDQILSSENKVRTEMLEMSRQLGVTCLTCHNLDNFADSKKLEFKTAQAHMKVTQTLIDLGMDGKEHHPQANCFMCHRGQLHPDYQLPTDPLLWPVSAKKQEP